jgi:amidase
MAYQSATQLLRLIKAGDISSSELLELYVSRIEKYNPAINAVVCMDLERARKAAAAADEKISKGQELGALHGLPMTVKEAFDVAGMPSTWGVLDLKDNNPAKNSHVFDALTKAGAIVFGKTNVPAWLSDWQSFNPVYGTTNNPWDVARVPGGSSGGSAAATAAGLSACEYGSDIAGSIRGPAHFCGVYGHKPTCGIVSQRGHAPPGATNEPDIAAVGPIARSATDLELLLRTTVGVEEHKQMAWQLSLPESTKESLSEFQVAVIDDDPSFPVDDEVKQVLEQLYEELEKNGVSIHRDIRPKLDSREVMDLFGQMRYAAVSDGQTDELFNANKERLDGLSEKESDFLARSLRGFTMSHYQWLRLNQRREELRQEWDRVFATVDLVLCPPAMTVAFPHDQKGERHERMVEVNGKLVPGTDETFWAGLSGFFHLPATVAPAGFGHSGMPVGVQIVGQRYMDFLCIHFAQLLEQQIVGFVAPDDHDIA